MNVWLLIRAAASCKTEVKIVLAALGVLLLLPTFAVVVIASSGLAIVSSALAAINPITHKVEVRDPNGNIIVELDATTVWPTNGPVTQEFGVPNLPYEAHHTGIDIAGDYGDPVTPFMAGTVIKSGDITLGCGKCVYVDHGNNIVSQYSHLSEVLAFPGDEVEPGDVVGLQGETGWAHGVHLHFVIKVYGVPVDPRIFMVGEPPLELELKKEE